MRCSRFDFRNCLMRGVGGMATQLTRVNAPSVSRSGQPSQIATLEQFARSLAAQQLRLQHTTSKLSITPVASAASVAASAVAAVSSGVSTT